MTVEECYRILGISRRASQEEIKAAYLKLIKQWHPDLNKSLEAKEKAKKINEAYETLIKHPANPNPFDLWDAFYKMRNPFGTDPFAGFDFSSNVARSSVVLEMDETNTKDLGLVSEVLAKAGFIVRKITITKYH